MTNSVYHEGEFSDLASRSAGAIADRIPDRAIQFIEQQAMVVIGSMDALGQVWASVVFGQPGFMHAIDVQRLELDRTLSGTSSKDPLWSHLDSYANVGILFIELASRF